MHIALINTNRIHPPIAPIGIDYVAEAIVAAGHEVTILDLCWEEDWQTAIRKFFAANDFGLIGMTLRNTDDCFSSSKHSFLSEFQVMVTAIRQATQSPIILGGAGFSVMPRAILSFCPADAGIWNDGEFLLPKIADCLEKNQSWHHLPNLIYQKDGMWKRSEQTLFPLQTLPIMSRQWVDNPRYYKEGGQIGIETKRGCTCNCIYCADPIAKGRQIRLRPPDQVITEWRTLINQGITHFHCCDSEFNLPPSHAKAICEQLISKGLNHQMQWYAYCSPAGFDESLAKAMREAGCAGINFGADSGDNGMLDCLRRDFTPDDITRAVQACHTEGITVMLDLLLGAPGETRESITQTLNHMKKTKAERIGISLGIRLYPETELTNKIIQTNPHYQIKRRQDLLSPIFYIDPAIKDLAPNLIKEQIKDDPRFFFSDQSTTDKDYNYNDNKVLKKAIQKGMRGAYWDILRKISLEEIKQ